MKAKKLKKSVENALTIIEIFLFMIVVSVNDFNLYGFFLWITLIGILFFINGFIEKYGGKQNNE